MKCSEVSSSLAEYLYNELDRAQRAPIHDHLAECAECSESLQQMGVAKAWLDTAEEPPATASVVPVFVRQASELQRRAKLWRRSAAACAALAATLLLLITWDGGNLVVRLRGQENRAEATSKPTLAEFAVLERRLQETQDQLKQMSENYSRLVQIATRQEQFMTALERAAAEGRSPQDSSQPFSGVVSDLIGYGSEVDAILVSAVSE